jgi:hypothetical protein
VGMANVLNEENVPTCQTHNANRFPFCETFANALPYRLSSWKTRSRSQVTSLCPEDDSG